ATVIVGLRSSLPQNGLPPLRAAHDGEAKHPTSNALDRSPPTQPAPAHDSSGWGEAPLDLWHDLVGLLRR
ncbi:MAG: hypothetical protein ACLPVY_04635, partial [Acidimicrobiia bacterium]